MIELTSSFAGNSLVYIVPESISRVECDKGDRTTVFLDHGSGSVSAYVQVKETPLEIARLMQAWKNRLLWNPLDDGAEPISMALNRGAIAVTYADCLPERE